MNQYIPQKYYMKSQQNQLHYNKFKHAHVST